jgi:sulfatase maturation enzyme AslB (radical SAM superfamily)
MEAPRNVFIEASSKCQLRCPLCDTPARKERPGVIGWGTLTFRDFRRFLDRHPQVKSIGLSTHGELFLNQELPGIMRYASDKGVELSGISNLNTLKPATAECMVRSGFARLMVSIDGTDQRVYEMYRRGGKLLRVLTNIRLINRLKDKYKSLFPALTWIFVAFDHNEHQIAQARAMAVGLRMSFLVRFSWEPGVKVKDRQAVVRRREFGAASRQEFAQKYKKAYFAPCLQVWKSPQINWDGKLLGCCMNQRLSFGNVLRSGLLRCMASPSYREWQDVIVGKRRLTPDAPCFGCEAYGSLAGRIRERRRGVPARL